MLRGLIIDDEPRNRKILYQLLVDYCPDIEVLGEADAADTGINAIRSLNPNLVFLDIELPYGNAFDMLNQLMPVNFEVIFITAFNNYAIKAFRYNALDYLLKPVNIEELKTAIEKARVKLNQQNPINEQLNNLLNNLKSENAVQKLALPTQEGLHFVNIDQVAWLEALGSYSKMYLSNHENIIVLKSMKELEQLLPDDIFYRVHHSHIINLNHIKKYQKGRGGFVIMEDGAIIEVSARKKDEFLSKFRT